MLMDCGAYNATNDNENTKFLEKKTSIFLENDPHIKGLIEKIKIIKQRFEEEIADNTLYNLIEEYKNALDHAAKDENVKRCLDAYNEAFFEKNEIRQNSFLLKSKIKARTIPCTKKEEK